MDQLAYEMAERLPAGLNLADAAAVAQALHAAGYRPREITENLDAVMTIALSERDVPDAASSAVLDCIATAALFGGGTAAIFIANIFDASISEAMASTLPNEICESIEYAAGVMEFGVLAGAGLMAVFWLAVWSMAWRAVPARVKRRRPF